MDAGRDRNSFPYSKIRRMPVTENHQEEQTSVFNSSPVSINIPPPPTTPSTPPNFRKSERQYWKWTFRLTLLPAVLWGIPTHLVLLRRSINTTVQWVKAMLSCSNPCVFFVTILLFISSIGLNIYILYNVVYIFDIVIIRGELRESLLFSIFELLQNLPMLIPMNYVWIYGYRVRDLVASFSKTMTCEASESFQYYQATSFEFQAAQPSRSRIKLIFIYVIIAFIHVIHAIMYGNQIRKNKYDQATIWEHSGNYFIGPFLSTMVLPTYMVFCWACKRQFELLSFYLKSLMNVKLQPVTAHFDRFKAGFKETSDRVQRINSMYAIYISFVMISILISMHVELWDLMHLFFNRLGTIIDDSIAASQNVTTTPGPTRGPDTLDIDPAEVRSLVVIVLVILLKLGLIYFTYWQAVGVNDEAKYLMVWLNDFVTEPNAALSIETYQAFRLLRYYVQSRMQQPRTSLMRIPLASPIPCLQRRLHSYQRLY